MEIDKYIPKTERDPNDFTVKLLEIVKNAFESGLEFPENEIRELVVNSGLAKTTDSEFADIYVKQGKAYFNSLRKI